MALSGSSAVGLLWIEMRKSLPCLVKLIFKYSLLVCFLLLIRLLGDIESEWSFSYRFGLARLSLAQFGPVWRLPILLASIESNDVDFVDSPVWER